MATRRLVSTLFLAAVSSKLSALGLFNILSPDQNLGLGCSQLGGALFGILLLILLLIDLDR
jgi:hypothetical protein